MRKGLIEERKKKGYTQSDMAEKIGVTRSCYAHYEQGSRDIKLARLLKIKKALDIKSDGVFLNHNDTICVCDKQAITKTG